MGVGVSASYGFTGSINEAQYAVANSPTDRGHVDGCAPSADTGTREVAVASGTVWALGGYHTVSGATVALPENTSGQPRIDTIVLNIDYLADDAAVTYVQGTPAASPVPPNLIRNAGLQWQVPLADVTVASGAGVLSASAVQDTRPGPWIGFTPESPWQEYIGSGTFQTSGYRLVGTTVQMRGLPEWPADLAFPAGANTPLIVTLPHRWCPTNGALIFAAPAHPRWVEDWPFTGEALVRVDVDVYGFVRAKYVRRNESGINRRWLSLAPIRFDISDNERL